MCDAPNAVGKHLLLDHSYSNASTNSKRDDKELTNSKRPLHSDLCNQQLFTSAWSKKSLDRFSEVQQAIINGFVPLSEEDLVSSVEKQTPPSEVSTMAIKIFRTLSPFTSKKYKYRYAESTSNVKLPDLEETPAVTELKSNGMACISPIVECSERPLTQNGSLNAFNEVHQKNITLIEQMLTQLSAVKCFDKKQDCVQTSKQLNQESVLQKSLPKSNCQSVNTEEIIVISDSEDDVHNDCTEIEVIVIDDDDDILSSDDQVSNHNFQQQSSSNCHDDIHNASAENNVSKLPLKRSSLSNSKKENKFKKRVVEADSITLKEGPSEDTVKSPNTLKQTLIEHSEKLSKSPVNISNLIACNDSNTVCSVLEKDIVPVTQCVTPDRRTEKQLIDECAKNNEPENYESFGILCELTSKSPVNCDGEETAFTHIEVSSQPLPNPGEAAVCADNSGPEVLESCSERQELSAVNQPSSKTETDLHIELSVKNSFEEGHDDDPETSIDKTFDPLLESVILLMCDSEDDYFISQGLQMIINLTTQVTKPSVTLISKVISIMTRSENGNVSLACYNVLCHVNIYHTVYSELNLWSLIEASCYCLEEFKNPQTIAANVLLIKFITKLIEDDNNFVEISDCHKRRKTKALTSRFLNPLFHLSRIKLLQKWMATAVSDYSLSRQPHYKHCLSRIIKMSLVNYKNALKSDSAIIEEFCSLYCQLDNYDHRIEFLNYIQPNSIRLHTVAALLDNCCDVSHLSQDSINQYSCAPLSLRKIMNYYFFMGPLSIHSDGNDVNSSRSVSKIYSTENYVEYVNAVRWLVESFMSVQKQNLDSSENQEGMNLSEFDECVKEFQERIFNKCPSLQHDRIVCNNIRRIRISLNSS